MKLYLKYIKNMILNIHLKYTQNMPLYHSKLKNISFNLKCFLKDTIIHAS